MPRRGGPRKPGKRTKSGRLVRAFVPDKGSERVAAVRDKYGPYATEAIGRAYAGNLLGEENDGIAVERYRKGDELAAAWRRHFPSVYRCALDQTPRGSSDGTETDSQIKSWEWASEQADLLKRAGLWVHFRQFALVQHPDSGPPWLDRILEGTGHRADHFTLSRCIDALDMIGSNRKQIMHKPVDVRKPFVYAAMNDVSDCA